MRPPKSRSRSKNNNNNRNRSVGNIVNRVFDSSGPEGKVRGTPQQIIEKYGQLARDAHLSNDRVAVENFQQHSEHYTRMLGEATREAEAKREQQERENRDRQQSRDEPNQQRRNDHQPRQDDDQQPRRNDDQQPRRNDEQQPRRNDEQPKVADGDQSQNVGDGAQLPDFAQPVAAPQADPAVSEQPDVIEAAPSSDSGLVETPEEAKPRRKPRPRKPKPVAVDAPQQQPDAPEAAE